MLGYFLFMVVVFSASGIGNAGKLGRIESAILNLSMFALPATCVVSALIVVYLYWRGGSAASYWWYGFPLAAAALYLTYATWLNNRG
jgi:hypothetical protein